MRKTFVRFLFPGIMFSEQSTREVPSGSRDPEALRPYPKGAFCFTFFDVLETEVEGQKLVSDELNTSARFYIGGQVHPKDALPEGSSESLKGNLESYGTDYGIKCRTGNWQPFYPDKGDSQVAE